MEPTEIIPELGETVSFTFKTKQLLNSKSDRYVIKVTVNQKWLISFFNFKFHKKLRLRSLITFSFIKIFFFLGFIFTFSCQSKLKRTINTHNTTIFTTFKSFHFDFKWFFFTFYFQWPVYLNSKSILFSPEWLFNEFLLWQSFCNFGVIFGSKDPLSLFV